MFWGCHFWSQILKTRGGLRKGWVDQIKKKSERGNFFWSKLNKNRGSYFFWFITKFVCLERDSYERLKLQKS